MNNTTRSGARNFNHLETRPERTRKVRNHIENIISRNKVKALHPGFKAVQEMISKKSGVSSKAAGAILANSSRHASKEAKKKNPRLNRVKG